MADRNQAQIVAALPVTVRLPWPNPVLSPNSRAHRMHRARATKQARWEAFLLCREAGVPQHEAAPRVRVTFHPPRRGYDADNCISRLKAHLDGVADAIDVDDRHWDVSFHRGEPVKRGMVVVEIGPGSEAVELTQGQPAAPGERRDA